MSQMDHRDVSSLWERLVGAALRRERTRFVTYGCPAGGIVRNVPPSLSNKSDIDAILRAADEIEFEDPKISRILYEYAYTVTPSYYRETWGLRNFKTRLKYAIKQKLERSEGAGLDRSQDITHLQEFYKLYREKNDVDKLREEEMELRESGTFSGNFQELKHKTVKRERVFATLKVLGIVLEQVSRNISRDIPDELKRVIESDAAMTEDLIAYNIIPLDAPDTTNAITSFPEVRAAISSLKYFSGLPKLPPDFPVPATRSADVLDFLHYFFGFQEGNILNQRENIVNLLSNEQSQLCIPDEHEPKLDETAVNNVFIKSLDNYIKWCNYLGIPPMWSNTDVSKEKKILFISLYFLIWGEAANVRYLPECLCYIFHHMGKELDDILKQQLTKRAASCFTENGASFLEQVICPIYDAIADEAGLNKNGKSPHSAWRNYDDLNEYFWSPRCFELEWPFKIGPCLRSNVVLKLSHFSSSYKKTSFVEHRTFFHLYHSFHRLWIFLFMMFQALAIIAFNDGKLDGKTVREVLSLGPTFFVMKLFQSALDIVMMYGAFSTTGHWTVSRIFVRFLWFSFATIFICFLYVKGLQDTTNSISGPIVFKIYVIVLGIYAGIQFFGSSLARLTSCHHLVKWIHQENYYVGRGMNEATPDYILYMFFWLIVLGGKFAFAYFLQISPLIKPTRQLINIKDLNNHNVLTIASLWVPVFCIYLLDIHIFYTIISAVVGFLLGARDGLGVIKSLGAVHKFFERFPEAFMDNLHIPLANRNSLTVTGQVLAKNKFDAAHFSPFWNEIVNNLREEDYITNLEMELLQMPKNSGFVPMVQWPLFLLAGKIPLAKDIARESYTQEEMWDRISRDNYMKYAVEECFCTIKLILTSVLDNDGEVWVKQIYEDINASIVKRNIHYVMHMKELAPVIQKVAALTGILKEVETPELKTGAVNAAIDLFNLTCNDCFHTFMTGSQPKLGNLRERRKGRLFSKLKWPSDPELRSQIRRLHLLFTIKDSAVNVPRNLEARRRLEFFTNSLFMSMPRTKPVREMLSFSVFTPYYSETVLYSMNELLKKNEDGISILFYLQNIFPDEWKNFLARIGRDENTNESVLIDNPDDNLELRFWASYRGQTLARTVRGMMYYRKALMLQAYLERMNVGDMESQVTNNEATDTKGFEFSPEARAHADLKFTYVVTCQMYGKQKEDQRPEAADIGLLLQRNEALRVAFIDEVEAATPVRGKEFFSKLVKGDFYGKDKEVYSIKLPGNPFLGEGKPENHNHAIVFTRGNALQTIDMNQDNYFEEALKMRNLLEEFHAYHGIRPATILGVREHVFTGSVSSLASFMSNQETSFVTLGQRVLATPLKVRMHYGHPDVFDRVFHITRGGICKASRVINISEDIYAGFNSTLRQGNISHHEYIQVGKGRDVGLNQIALFEGKVAGGNGEQVLSRDVYRLGQLFDFFRMLSFYSTTVGFYFCNMLTVITLYIFLYGKLYLALSGVGEDIQNRADILDNRALNAALNTQILFQIGVFTAIPMVLGFILEQEFLRAVVSFITMQFQLCAVFFTFSLGTRTHYFGRTILHGGAKYHATGRGFVVRHIRFSENYRLYSRSHFVKAFEILLLVVYCAYGFNEAGVVGNILLSVSSWFMAISWLFAPYLFNPSGFEWHKTVEDFHDWTNWLLNRAIIRVKGEVSWEAWWNEELSHIRTLGGRIMETIFGLRFFIFQYGVVYKLYVQRSNMFFSVFVLIWLVAVRFIFHRLEINTIDLRRSVNSPILRFAQVVAFMVPIVGIPVVVVITELTITDIFASILAFIPTGWGILSICVAWKPVLENKIGLWEAVRSLALFFDAGMGMLIFVPVALCSWFPFISIFQRRLMYNQAFSRGLEISLILAGNNPNS